MAKCKGPSRADDGFEWGPGPEGPGTVCDRCHKKMKQVERRSTLDPHSQTSAFVHSRPHAPIQERDHPHGPPAQQGTGCSIGRTDTVVVSHPPLPRHACLLPPLHITPPCFTFCALFPIPLPSEACSLPLFAFSTLFTLSCFFTLHAFASVCKPSSL